MNNVIDLLKSKKWRKRHAQKGATLLSEDDVKRLAIAFVTSCEDDGSEVDEDTFAKIVDWAVSVKINDGLLQTVLMGSLMIGLREDGEPTFKITKSGISHVEDMLKGPDDEKP